MIEIFDVRSEPLRFGPYPKPILIPKDNPESVLRLPILLATEYNDSRISLKPLDQF